MTMKTPSYGSDMSTRQKQPSTRHNARTASDNRRSGRLLVCVGGICRSAHNWPIGRCVQLVASVLQWIEAWGTLGAHSLGALREVETLADGA